VPILVRFGEFAKDRGASWNDLPSHVEAFVERWLTERTSGRISKNQRNKIGQGVRNPIQQMLRLTVPGYSGMGRSRKPENPFEDSAPHFFEYLRNEKGLKDRTSLLYKHYLRQFASYLQRIGVQSLEHISPAVLSGFSIEYAQRVHKNTLRNACGSLRVFLRYLHRERILTKDFSSAVDHVQSYRLSGVPRSITWDQVRLILESVDRRTPTGKRDYAILLLLVTYGLRAGEVAALALDDIDWKNSRLKVPERKAGHSTAYPLSPVVGDAILDYLKNGRPETAKRHIFFRSFAPRLPIGSAAVSARASHYIRKACIQVSRAGSHTLRHTCVQRLVDADFSLKTIGDYVGHRSPSSTQIYSKVAIEALRQVALGDGEEAI
jgi:site-specific recombinase XerD